MANCLRLSRGGSRRANPPPTRRGANARKRSVAPSALAELFSYLTSPGITDEEVTVLVAAVDATQVPPRVVNPAEGEHIETLRVSIDAAIAALAQGTMRSGPLIMGLQWLALNRGRVATLLGVSGRAR
jgi:ADP-ribose pyrophosphatase